MRLGWGGAVLLSIWACSSSTTTTSNAGGASGSAGTGGATGGSSGAGGSDGAATGGEGGTGGGSGAGGGSDAGSDAPLDVAVEASAPVVGIAGSVWCGAAAPSCSLANGGKCCYSGGGDAGPSFVCQTSAASCPTLTIRCDSNNDCASGQVCCLSSKLLVNESSATCKAAGDCQKSTSDAGVTTSFATQLCDPTKTSPTECVYPAGSSCKPVITSSIPAQYFICK